MILVKRVTVAKDPRSPSSLKLCQREHQEAQPSGKLGTFTAKGQRRGSQIRKREHRVGTFKLSSLPRGVDVSMSRAEGSQNETSGLEGPLNSLPGTVLGLP